jgi:hypothetical protein
LRLGGYCQQPPQKRIAPLRQLIVVTFLIAHAEKT